VLFHRPIAKSVQGFPNSGFSGGLMIRVRHLFVFPLLILAFSLSNTTLAQDRERLAQEIASLKTLIKEKEKEFLEPSKEDKVAYGNFLTQPDRGIFRLTQRGQYQDKLLINGAGAYYSFSRLVHEYGYGSDIELAHGKFTVGFAGADFGFITLIGDVPLDEVTLTHPAIEFLASFKTPTKEPQAREQARISGSGVAAQGFTYSRNTDARINRTFALRSINYRDSDVLVAFRVVRQDTDGSLIIIWKLLKDFPTPILERM
jgi:hypothetical protein